jgi:hypothetical protein
MELHRPDGLGGVGALALVAALLLAIAGCDGSDDPAQPRCDATTLTGTTPRAPPPLRGGR